MHKKRLITVLATLTVVTIIFGSASTASADLSFGNTLPLEQRQVQEFTIQEPPHPGHVWYLYSVNAAMQLLFAAPPLMWTDKNLCHEADFTCLADAKRFTANGFFGDCNGGASPPCIESIEGRNRNDSEWVRGTIDREIDWLPSQADLDQFVRSINSDMFGGVVTGVSDNKGWAKNDTLGLYASADAPLSFRIPGVLNEGGTDTYLVDSRYSVRTTVSDGTPIHQAPENVFLNIRPFVTVPGGSQPLQAYRNGPTGSGGVTPGQAFTSKKESGLAVAFKPDSEFRVTFQLPNEIAGWFHGRMKDTDVQISKLDSQTNRVTVTGKSVMVPFTGVGWPFFSEQAVKFRAENSIVWDPHSVEVFQKIEDSGVGGGGTGTAWSPDSGLDQEFKAFEPYFPPAALGQMSLWSLSTISRYQTVTNPCLNRSDALQGVITTNAMAYQGGVPRFSEGTLKYQVAGVHFDPNNQVFHGTYDLVMRSDAARCLYGFSSAPISATISVIDSAGDADVAVTSFAEKDGWITLSAHNFTFSDPIISVKLSGEIAQPESTQSSGETSVKTIKCVAKAKPYKTKTVKGKSPKCPKGYVKKSK